MLHYTDVRNQLEHPPHPPSSLFARRLFPRARRLSIQQLQTDDIPAMTHYMEMSIPQTRAAKPRAGSPVDLVRETGGDERLASPTAAHKDVVRRLLLRIDEVESERRHRRGSPSSTQRGREDSVRRGTVTAEASSAAAPSGGGDGGAEVAHTVSPAATVGRTAQCVRGWVGEEQRRATTALAASAVSPHTHTHRYSERSGPRLSLYRQLDQGKFRRHGGLPEGSMKVPCGATAEGNVGELTVGGEEGGVLQQLREQPIQSYNLARVLQESPRPCYPHDATALDDASKRGAVNLQRLRHRFEHTRYTKHAEIEDFLRWRASCRCVVSAAVTRSKDSAAVMSRGTSSVDAVLDEVFEAAPSHRQRPFSASYARSPFLLPKLRSAWTAKAYEMAMEDEKKQLCARLDAYELPATASALSKEAVQQLCAEVVRGVQQKPSVHPTEPLFTRRDFLRLLHRLGYLVACTLSEEAQFDVMVAEVVDRMPSPAEASFAEYALQVLPA